PVSISDLRLPVSYPLLRSGDRGDSNPHQESHNLSCYHYTTATDLDGSLEGTPARFSFIISGLDTDHRISTAPFPLVPSRSRCSLWRIARSTRENGAVEIR